MTYFIIYLAGILILLLLLPPIDPQEITDVLAVWVVAFLWPIFVLFILLIIGGIVVLSIMYTVATMCQLLTHK